MSIEQIRAAIRDIPDFPEPGIVFKDITPVLNDPVLFRDVIDTFAGRYQAVPPDRIVAIDARGFIFGAALAYRLGTGLVIVRKKGKLPWKTETASYQLEYGTNTVEIHVDAVARGEKVMIIDDVLATGGTARAAVDLVERLGGEVVGVEFLMELAFLKGRAKLEGYPVNALIEI